MLVESPIGTMLACATESGVCLLEFTGTGRANVQLNKIKKTLNAELSDKNSRFFPILKNELEEYFGGVRKSFSIPLVLTGTDFQKKAWSALLNIPYGETRSYLEQAMSIGNSRAVRAIGGANRANKIVILIPCHRVIGSNGELVGFGAGLWRKRYLLGLESGKLNENRID